MKRRDKKLEIKASRSRMKHARGIIPDHAIVLARDRERNAAVLPSQKFHFASAINNDRKARRRYRVSIAVIFHGVTSDTETYLKSAIKSACFLFFFFFPFFLSFFLSFLPSFFPSFFLLQTCDI